MPGPMHRDSQEKPKDLKKALRKLLVYCKKQRGIIVAALILAALGALLNIVGPNRIGEITDLMAAGLSGSIDMAAVARVGFLLVGLYGTAALCSFLQQFTLVGVTQQLSLQFRQDISRKINRLPLKYFGRTTTGDVLSRVTNDVDTMGQTLANSIATLVAASIQFAGCLIMMFVTNAVMALSAIAATFIGFFLMMSIMKHSQKYFAQRQKALGVLNGYVEEVYSGHAVIRASSANRPVLSRFGSMNQEVYDANWKSQFLSGMMQPLMGFIGNLAYVAVCVVGALLTMNGSITFGVIVSFILYTRLFTSPLSQIAQGMTNLQSATAAAERVFELLDEEEMEDETAKTASLSEVEGEVNFEHVQFSYPEKPDKLIIKDFSAHIRPGQKVAIVGPTGAGKTTLVNLLMRFYEANSGSISIDGVPVTQLPRADVHRLFGMVLQDTWLFEGTVRENLLYNHPQVSQEEMVAACKACGIHHFIKTLPHGYDTVLNDNTNISAGQKQLLTIARAMIQNSPMLILDEATSSVDTRTELLTQRAMDTLTTGRTSFVIAHRLSTIKNADLILVLKDGDIVEQGSHEQLLQADGFYADLYRSQFESA